MMNVKQTKKISRLSLVTFLLITLHSMLALAYESVDSSYHGQPEYIGGFSKPQLVIDADTYRKLDSEVKNSQPKRLSSSAKAAVKNNRQVLIDIVEIERLKNVSETAVSEKAQEAPVKLEKDEESIIIIGKGSDYAGIIIGSEDVVQPDTCDSDNLAEEELRLVKPVSSGYTEVLIDDAQEREAGYNGIDNLVRLISKLVLGMGASSIMTFSSVEDTRWDSASADSLDDLYRTENVLDSIRRHLLG